ncbi:hypothetical protein GCM10023084_15500 [Streptomyces lacrimifluminis]|uniref:Uncharacterized protein n=1 Tax=Streptomyces lacrimifluminis TaxID=1500077 RepID=A0A917KJL7_9ACTN|nr:hypothetical protein GCM10012282_11210 [Streptomyces lacrimifluminis]
MVQYDSGDHAGAEEDQNRCTDDLADKDVPIAHGGSWALARGDPAPADRAEYVPMATSAEGGEFPRPPGVRDERAAAAESHAGKGPWLSGARTAHCRDTPRMCGDAD